MLCIRQVGICHICLPGAVGWLAYRCREPSAHCRYVLELCLHPLAIHRVHEVVGWGYDVLRTHVVASGIPAGRLSGLSHHAVQCSWGWHGCLLARCPSSAGRLNELFYEASSHQSQVCIIPVTYLAACWAVVQQLRQPVWLCAVDRCLCTWHHSVWVWVWPWSGDCLQCV